MRLRSCCVDPPPLDNFRAVEGPGPPWLTACPSNSLIVTGPSQANTQLVLTFEPMGVPMPPEKVNDVIIRVHPKKDERGSVTS